MHFLPLAALVGIGAFASVSKCRAPTGVVASTYFAGYHVHHPVHPVAISTMQWDKYTDAKWAFAETMPDGSLDLSKSAPEQIPAWVAEGKKHGVKVGVSSGGWGGSGYFSTSVGSAENRTAFVKTVIDMVKKYDLDLFDFDWEYMNRQGIGCNTLNKDDTANFLLFLQELRAHPDGKKLYLTAAASLFPWNDANGKQSTDLKAFADVLDYLMIMVYDLYGQWADTAGPNAPLAFACDARNNQGGGKEGVEKWMAAGIPANKIVFAVPAYGHSFNVNTTSAFDASGALNAYPNQTHKRIKGGDWDSDPPVDRCGNANPPGGTYTFWGLVEAGFLDQTGAPAPGIVYGYDKCSQTPYLYNKATEVWVSYDNVQSLTAKGQYIKQTGLAGFGLWEAAGDLNNILVNAIRAAVGLS